MKKILFLHGFYASRQCVPATKQQLQASVLDRKLIEQVQVNTPKEVSSLVPNVEGEQKDQPE